MSIAKIQENWDNILSYMKNDFEITKISFETFIIKLKPSYMKKQSSDNGSISDVLVIIYPADQGEGDMIINYLHKKYSKLLRISIEEVTGIACDIEFQFAPFSQEQPVKKETAEPSFSESTSFVPDLSTNKKANLNPKYTFDSFVVGNSNRFAHAASLAAAESPGTQYNPLYIYGGVGLGKTHLMQSIAHFILKNNPEAKVLYVTSETFTNEIINAIGTGRTQEFHDKYRTLDVLLIDDIQFIINKSSTQEEFFHTFNCLYENNKQIVISSDMAPRNLETLNERYRSRFTVGLPVDISSPDYETRMAILRKKEEMDNCTVDNSILSYIATNITSNIRDLEGALNKVTAYSKLYNQDMTLEMAEEALKDLINPNAGKEITIKQIILVVADHFQISPDDLMSSKRTKEIVRPRQIVMYLCRKMTSASLMNIATALNKKDHSTIIHGANEIEETIKNNKELQETVDVLIKKLSPA